MGDQGDRGRWAVGARAILGIPVDRARLRTTLTYAVSEELRLGIEVNPLGEDVGPLANWRIVDETQGRPALVLGTSSDRIGTEHGRAIYLTASKDLEAATDLPIAPYVGLSYGTHREQLDAIAGLTVRWRERWSSTHLYDGRNLHHLVTRALEGHQTVSLVVVEQDEEYYLGLAWSVGIGE
jgi:hypothetical protein